MTFEQEIWVPDGDQADTVWDTIEGATDEERPGLGYLQGGPFGLFLSEGPQSRQNSESPEASSGQAVSDDGWVDAPVVQEHY
jgi:hypothetical protein